MKIAVCDDNLEYLKRIKVCIGKFFSERDIDYEISAFSSGMELCSLEKDICKFQVIFLDSEMPGMDGIAVAKKIREIVEDVPIVFVSAFIEYAPKGYSVNAYAYILKDNLEIELRECLKQLLQRGNLQERSIELNDKGDVKNVYMKNILWIESNGRVLTFNVMEDGEKRKYYLNQKLDVIEKELNYEKMIRIHKSFLVNGEIITKVKNYEAYLRIGEKEEIFSLPIPKEKYGEVKKKWLEYRENM